MTAGKLIADMFHSFVVTSLKITWISEILPKSARRSLLSGPTGETCMMSFSCSEFSGVPHSSAEQSRDTVNFMTSRASKNTLNRVPRTSARPTRGGGHSRPIRGSALVPWVRARLTLTTEYLTITLFQN